LDTLVEGLRRCVLVLLPPGPDTVRRMRGFEASLRRPYPYDAPLRRILIDHSRQAFRPASSAPGGCQAPACSPSRVTGKGWLPGLSRRHHKNKRQKK
jgi:hypothetical protein